MFVFCYFSVGANFKIHILSCVYIERKKKVNNNNNKKKRKTNKIERGSCYKKLI